MEHAPVIVYASNSRLAGWVGNVSERTITRNLARLEAAGMIGRHYSANGKRYARRSAAGHILVSFGVDVAPFFRRSAEIRQAAERARAEADTITELRERILALVDRLKHATHDTTNQLLDEARKLVRRVGSVDAMREMAARLGKLCSGNDADKLATTGRHSVCHKDDRSEDRNPVQVDAADCERAFPKLSRELQTLCGRGEERALPHALEYVAMKEGISQPTWYGTLRRLGQGTAMICLGYLMQSRHRVQHPGAYFSSLADRVETGQIDLRSLVIAGPKRSGRAARRRT